MVGYTFLKILGGFVDITITITLAESYGKILVNTGVKNTQHPGPALP